jgi:hypothetical protein
MMVSTQPTKPELHNFFDKKWAWAGWESYPEAALAGALVAGDAIDPEDVAAGVHLHVVLLGRRPDLDLRVVEPARRVPPFQT